MKNIFSTPINGDIIKTDLSLDSLFSRFGGILSREVLYLIMGSLILSAVIIRTDGDAMAPMAFLGMIVLLVTTFYRLDWGFYFFFAIVMLVDQFPPVEFANQLITYKVQYLDNVKTLKYLPSISAGVMTPMELHLFLLFSVWLLIGLAKQNLGLNRIGAWGLGLLFLFSLIGWLAFGISNGGVFINALWEIRAMFYMVIFMFFAPQIIQTKTHVKALIWIMILALTYKSIQATYFFVTVGGSSFEQIPAFTSHEDPIFIVALFALGLGLFLLKAYRAQLAVLLLCLLPLLAGFHVGQRRAAFAACGTTLCVFLVVLDKQHRRKITMFLIPFLVCFALYLGAFWNSNSAIGSFAKTIKSGFVTDKSSLSEEDYLSNLWRDIEKYNLAVTVQRAPIIGVGYGNKYDQPIKPLEDLWSLDGYVPHNMMLDVIVKSGAIGCFIFWFFMNGTAFYGASLYAKLQDPYLKVICIVGLAMIVNQMVVSYFDLQLTYTRNMVLLGIFIGLLTNLKKIDEREHGPLEVQEVA
jgi:hypothetical protein